MLLQSVARPCAAAHASSRIGTRHAEGKRGPPCPPAERPRGIRQARQSPSPQDVAVSKNGRQGRQWRRHGGCSEFEHPPLYSGGRVGCGRGSELPHWKPTGQAGVLSIRGARGVPAGVRCGCSGVAVGAARGGTTVGCAACKSAEFARIPSARCAEPGRSDAAPKTAPSTSTIRPPRSTVALGGMSSPWPS